MTPPPGGGALAPTVGNDVVDLEDPSTSGKHGDARFLAKVLNEAERGALAASADPAVELWALWAAKEAAYKVASKLRGTPPVFAHAAFSVAWTSVKRGCWRGQVTWRDMTVHAEVTRADTAVHAVAVSAAELTSARWASGFLSESREEWGRLLPELLPRFTPREADAVHSFPSAAVRMLARAALAETLGAHEGDVEIVCDPGVTGRRPPRVFLRGEPAPCDVSLSHHGRWVAWALLPQNQAGR